MITARESPCKESSRFLSGFKKKKTGFKFSNAIGIFH